MGFKAGSKLVRFPAWVLCFGRSRVQLGLLRLLSCGRLETAAWRHRESSPPQSLNSWLRYGFGTVLDPLRWLVSSRESSGPASRSALRAFERAVTSSWAPESCKREERNELADAPRLFNCPVWTPPTGGWSNQIVRMGRSPTHVHGFLGPCPLVIWYLIQCER